ncbi:MAG: multidrug transporter, partial [Bacteroidetes bacterium]|nr:multidrug transporter [Bacteroidota bacterium]
VRFGKNVVVKENAQISCFYGQKVEIGDNVEIFWGDIIKGNVFLGDNSKIESGVKITGSDQCPTTIGSNVTIKGSSYIFGSQIENNIFIEHSVLNRKKISKPAGEKSEDYKVRYYLPEVEGKEAVKDL